MIEILRREGVYLWYYFTVQFEQIFPYWVLGIVLGSVISVFGKRNIHDMLTALQGKRLGALGVIPASIIGIASPLSCYGTIPLTASFSEKGIRDDWLAAFMMSSILLNPQLIIYSAALGTTALVVRILTCFFGGALAGFLVRAFYVRKNKSFFQFDSFRELPSDRDTDPNILPRLLKNIWRNVRATGLYFFFGIVLSVLFQRYVPSGLMTYLFGNDEAWGVLMAATIGVPLARSFGGW
ncbi:permease [Clostridia bacterium]|nr:permease [Clostridia bacterium]